MSIYGVFFSILGLRLILDYGMLFKKVVIADSFYTFQTMLIHGKLFDFNPMLQLLDGGQFFYLGLIYLLHFKSIVILVVILILLLVLIQTFCDF